MNKKEAANYLGVSVRTIERLVQQNKISCRTEKNPNGGTITFFNEEELKQYRESSLVPTIKPALIPNSEFRTPNSNLSRRDKLEQEMTVFTEAYNQGISRDPLFDLELLQRLSDKKWLIPTSKLAVIVNKSCATLTRKKIHEYCGFVFSREVKNGNKILWKIDANNS